MALSTLKDESKMRSNSGYGLRFKPQTKVLGMEQKKGFMDEPLGAVELFECALQKNATPNSILFR